MREDFVVFLGHLNQLSRSMHDLSDEEVSAACCLLSQFAESLSAETTPLRERSVWQVVPMSMPLQ